MCAVSPQGNARTICTAELGQVTLSPSGRAIAELVDSVPSGCGSQQIIVEPVNEEGTRSEIITAGATVQQIEWANEETIAYVTGRDQNRLMFENIHTLHSWSVISAPSPIVQYAISPTGQSVEYAYKVLGAKPDYVSLRITDSRGVLADVFPPWAIYYGWSYFVNVANIGTLGGNVGRNILLRPYVSRLPVLRLMWLSHPARAVVLVESSKASPWERSVVDVSTGIRIVDGAHFPYVSTIAESSDGDLVVASRGNSPDEFLSFAPLHIYLVDGAQRVQRISGFQPADIQRMWLSGRALLWAQVEEEDYPGGPHDLYLVQFDLVKDRVVRKIGWPGGSLEQCEMDRQRKSALCVAKSLTQSSRVVTVDLKSGGITMLPIRAEHTHTLQGTFKEIGVRNGFGEWSTGFLAVPKHSGAGSGTKGAVPLVIMLYDFHRVFARDGQWVGAYPVEKLVQSGIGVLLLNFTNPRVWQRGDVKAARLRMLEGPLSTVESAPQAVEASGVKVGKVMVMGWSWGGFIAAHAIENSCKFVAAVVGDPARWDSTAYALENSQYRGFLELLFGGPPDDRYMANYLAFDPAHSGRPPKGPVMLEIVGSNVEAGQYFEEWKGVGAYMEAFAYHHSVHFLNVPAEARLARARNLAWAKVNLLGRGSVPVGTLRTLGLSVPPTSAYRCNEK